MTIAHGDGSFAPLLARLSKLDLFVLDDFLIGPLKDQERRDLVEILEDRYGHSSTVITTQIPTNHWHDKLADPTIADAICDRVTHNAHVIALRGPSIREKRVCARLKSPPQPNLKPPLVPSLYSDPEMNPSLGSVCLPGSSGIRSQIV